MTVANVEPSWPKRSYLTLAEYKASPTGLNTGTLSDAQITDLIRRASSFADNYCDQPLGAWTPILFQRVTAGSDGWVRTHPGYGPIVSVLSVLIGSTASNLAAISDLSGAYCDDDTINVPLTSYSMMSSAGPLSFAAVPASGRALAKITYVAGYFVGTIVSGGTQGTNTATLDNVLGLVPGQQVGIYDAASEVMTVQAINGLVVTFTTNFANVGHVAGTGVSAIPDDAKDAIIRLTTVGVKYQGGDGLLMQTTTPGKRRTDTWDASDDAQWAMNVLDSYRRVR